MRRGLAFLLRPGWIALALVVIAFTYLCFTVLAPWQLGKNTKTSRENAQISNSLSADPVPLKTLNEALINKKKRKRTDAPFALHRSREKITAAARFAKVPHAATIRESNSLDQATVESTPDCAPVSKAGRA